LVPRKSYIVPLPDGRTLELGARTLVMGVLNVTPDSFADGRPLLDPGQAVERALEMEAQGADIVDVGGESTRPGAEPVSADEELRRVVPVLRRLAGRLRVPVSIDTYKAAVAAAAFDCGAVIVNDISGLRYDRTLGAVAASRGAAVVLVHSRGRSADMYRDARYGSLVAEVRSELLAALDGAVAAGVERDRIILDPGFGFAKLPEHSYDLLAHLPDLASADRPLLIGTSRKSFLTRVPGETPPAGRDWATASSIAAAIVLGAHVVRVHAVPEMREVVRVADEIRRCAAR
jgi:dihydropteroate synthase